jgi:cytidyltransferase-like protein
MELFMKVVIVTGGFDPLHSGHIEYFKAAKELGDILCVGINSDAWLARKKGRAFMPFEERKAIVENIKCVGMAFGFNDDDGSAIKAIEHVREVFPRNTEFVFANGGDRTKDNIPEMVVDNVEFVFGVGGKDKKNSSSWILNEWKAPKTDREWGYYRVLHEDGKETKVKELVVNPNSELSLQRHKYRSEHWIVTDGLATVLYGWEPKYTTKKHLAKHQEVDIPVGCWHKLINETNQELKIVEIQHGTTCIEEDIERF